MNEREARKQYEKENAEAAKDPESVPYFVLAHDRYYYGMWMQPLPAALCKYDAQCGDLVILAYRKLDTETQWIIKLRFRFHLGANPSDPWNATDKKDWAMFKTQDMEEPKLGAEIQNILKMLAAGAPIIGRGAVFLEPSDFLELKCNGDNQIIEKIRAAKKDWMHIGDNQELEKKHYFSKVIKNAADKILAKEVEQTKPGVG